MPNKLNWVLSHFYETMRLFMQIKQCMKQRTSNNHELHANLSEIHSKYLHAKKCFSQWRLHPLTVFFCCPFLIHLDFWNNCVLTSDLLHASQQNCLHPLCGLHTLIEKTLSTKGLKCGCTHFNRSPRFEKGNFMLILSPSLEEGMGKIYILLNSGTKDFYAIISFCSAPSLNKVRFSNNWL